MLAALRAEFEQEYGIDMPGIIERVYRTPIPNRWLASLSPFINKHLDNSIVEDIVKENLSSFFAKNILPYNRPDLPVSFVGSIAFHYEAQLRSAAESYGVKIGTVRKSPL